MGGQDEVRSVLRLGRALVAAQVFGRALGTDCSITIVGTDPGTCHGRAMHLWEVLGALEATWSRFRADSEISRLNSLCAASDVETHIAVSSATATLLTSMVWAHEYSEGLVDSGLLREVEAAGYDRTFAQARRSVRDVEPEASPSASTIRVADGVARLAGGTSLDPGGVGKGLAADMLAAAFDDNEGMLIDLGGDLRARGCDVNGDAWAVGLADERQPDSERLAGVWHVSEAAVATSSVTRRRWSGGHHLIDPRTRRPSDSDLLAVTVESTHALQAEVCAKTALIAGSQFATMWLPGRVTRAALVFADDRPTVEIGRHAEVQVASTRG